MLNISEDNRKFAENFVEDFIERIQTLEDVKKYTEPELILYISEIIGTKYENKEIIDYCNELIESTVSKIEAGKLRAGGMFSDFGIFTFAINIINNKTGEMKKLSSKLNQILLKYGCKIIESSKKRKNLVSDYDCISGISGILYYLLGTNISESDSVSNLIEYLVYLTKSHDYKGNQIINFHIENEMLIREEERNIFREGCLNFGLAHGMSGSLMALSKAYKSNLFKKEILRNAIESIISLYEKFEYVENDIPYYPRQLDINNYINEIKNKDYNNASWCYGNISNAWVLYKSYETLVIKIKQNKYKEYLQNILNQNYEDYSLIYPVICHGYASVLMEQMTMYKEIQSKYFIRNVNRNVTLLKDSYVGVNREKHIDVLRLNNTFYEESIQGHREDFTLMMGSGGIFLIFLELLGYKLYYKKLFLFD